MGIENAKEPMDFIAALVKLLEDCGVSDLRMSDYGIKPEEFETLAKNAKNTMGRLFQFDRSELTVGDCIDIYSSSYNKI